MNPIFTRTLVGLQFLFFSTLTFAQWTSDPENPGIVCDANGQQIDLHAFEDGNGGIYAFWLDGRNSPSSQKTEIYGQHFDASGIAQWESNGRLIISHVKAITFFDIALFTNDELMIGWITQSPAATYPDSVHFQKLDLQGSPVWTQELIVGQASLQSSIIYFSRFNWIHDETGYVIDLHTVYYGGSSGNRITRISSDGTLLGPFNGEPEGTQYNFGSSDLLSTQDGSNDVYLYYSGGNGSGAGLFCMRINSAGDTVWGPKNMLEGTAGLSYQFTGIADAAGITFLWQGTGVNQSDIMARRFDGSGNLTWGMSPLSVCSAEGNQQNFFCRKKDNNFYVTWADGRPGTSPGYYDIYAQKFDIGGNLLWEMDGIQVASLNTYAPYPTLSFTDDDNLLICHQSTVAGYNAQKVTLNGALVWAPEGCQICTTTFNPNQDNHQEILAGNQMIAVWSGSPSSSAENIYISLINQNITDIQEFHSPTIHVSPNPCHDYLIIDAKGENVTQIDILTMQGNRVITHDRPNPNDGAYLRLDITGLEAGIYLLKLASGNRMYVRKFVKIS